MTIDKKAIIEALKQISLPGEGKNLIESEALKNVVVFGKEVIIDVAISNPTLQARKRTEVEILKIIHSEVNQKIDVKVNFKVNPDNKTPRQLIRGKKIEGIKNIIAVASGKGGVGKSTVTANLAITLSKMGFSVGILDADIYGPSIPLMFDVQDERPLSIKVGEHTKMKPVENYGIKILSIGFFTQKNQAVVWRGPMASKALNQMIFDAHWGVLDFMIVDLPPGTGDIHLSLIQALPITGAVVVSTPQTVALIDAVKGLSMFAQDSIKIPVLGLVENMAFFTPPDSVDKKYYLFGKEGVKSLSEQKGIPFLGQVPIVEALRISGDIGKPESLNSSSLVAESFYKITQNMVSQVLKRNKTLPPTEKVKITTMAGCNAVKN